MIKINLLGVAPPPSKAPTGPPAPKATQAILFLGALIIAFGIVWVVYEIWTHEITKLETRRSQEKLRAADLAQVRNQNATYQQKLKDLENRINTIQALQGSRTGPVELMSSLGNVVSRTADIYLYTLTPSGDQFQLKGQSGTVNSMADFIADLKNSGTFNNVQLVQFFQDDIHDRLAFKFTLSCEFRTPGGGVSPTAGGETTSGGPTPAMGPAAVPPNRPTGVPGPLPPPGQPQKLIR